MMDYKLLCAWCGTHISGPVDARYTSHTICEKCKKANLEEAEERFRKGDPAKEQEEKS